MAEKRTKPDKLERQTERLEKGVHRHSNGIEEKPPSAASPKSEEPSILISIERQIRQRAYELWEQRGRTDGGNLEDWLRAEWEIKDRQANSAGA